MVKIRRKHFIIACVLLILIPVAGYIAFCALEITEPPSKSTCGVHEQLNHVRPLFASGDQPKIIPALFPLESANSTVNYVKVEKIGFDRNDPSAKHHRSAKETGNNRRLPEFHRMKELATELARKVPNTGKIKACYDKKNSEWWIVIYENSGSGLALKQYVWPIQEDKPDPFLILRRIPREKFDWHLKSSEPGKICQVIDLDEKKEIAVEPKGPKGAPERSEPEKARIPDASSNHKLTRLRESRSANEAKSLPEKKDAPKVAKALKPSPQKPLDAEHSISQEVGNSNSRSARDAEQRPEKHKTLLQKKIAANQAEKTSSATAKSNPAQMKSAADTDKQRKPSSNENVQEGDSEAFSDADSKKTPEDTSPLTSYVKASAPPISPLITSDMDRGSAQPEKSVAGNTGEALPVHNQKIASLPKNRNSESSVDMGGVSVRGPRNKQRISVVADEVSDRPSAFTPAKQRQEIPTTFVFIYGTSMNHAELLEWLKYAGYDSSLFIDAVPAELSGYDFVWNYFSPSRGGGAVNLEMSPNSHVWGLLLEFQDKALKAFDLKEGHPQYYARVDNRVQVRRSDNGKTVFAWLYLAKSNRHGRRNVWPTTDYKNKILEAAMFWQFPNDYIDKIRSWNTQ